MPDRKPPLQVLCHHSGPRGRQYGIPAALAMNGMLAAFYTDFCISYRTARMIRTCWPDAVRPRAIQNVLSRTLPVQLPRSKSHCLAPWRVVGKSAKEINAAIREHIQQDDFGGADAIYSIFNPDLEMLQRAKSQGLKVIHDQVLNPDVGLIVQRERERFAGFEKQEDTAVVSRGIQRDKAQWQVADIILAPSSFVRDSIIALGGEADKIRLVPYGINNSWLQASPAPVPGRILFVGSVCLRKGTHYLAQATQILRSRGVDCDVVVVGAADSTLISRPEFQGPRYVGSVARSAVREWFLSADVLVHPSLSEGSAIAHIEALACGLPVVATPNAGTVIDDGVEGFIVPPGNPEVLADRLQQILQNRELRNRLSRAARARAQDMTFEAYAGRLGKALHELSHGT